VGDHTLVYGGKLSNMTNGTVSLLTKAEIILLNQNATEAPRPLVAKPQLGAGAGVQLGYQGLGYTVEACNVSDIRQRWSASRLPPPASGERQAGSVNVHKTFDKNGTEQQVCIGVQDSASPNFMGLASLGLEIGIFCDP
jgi:hypothetical protein